MFDINKMLKNRKAQVGTMELVVSVTIGLIVLGAIYSLAPIIGDKIDSSVEFSGAVAATGVLTISGNTADAETVTIEGVRYEFDTEGNVTAGRVAVPIADTNAATATVNLTAAINGNATTAALVTATSTSSTVNLTADDAGTAGNSIATDETMGNGAWGAITLTGGAETDSEWAADDVPTGVDIWKDNATLISLVVLVMIISLAIFYIRRMGGGGTSGGEM